MFFQGGNMDCSARRCFAFGICLMALLALGPAKAQDYTITAPFEPPTEVIDGSIPSADASRFSVTAGSMFTITCSVADYTPAYTSANVLFYRDDAELPDQDNVQDTRVLVFADFQATDNGFYTCVVLLLTMDVVEMEDHDNYAIFQTGPPRVTLVSGPYQALPPTGPLELEAGFEGVYYSHSWVYHPTDPDSTSATVLAGVDGVEEDTARGRIAIQPTSPAFMAGYYIARINMENGEEMLRAEAILVSNVVSLEAELSGQGVVQVGQTINLTCIGRGDPEVNVNVTHSGLIDPVVIGEQMLVASATPTTPAVVSRTVEVESVSYSNTIASVVCEARGVVNGTPEVNSTSVDIEIAFPLEAELSGQRMVRVGENVSLTCTGRGNPGVNVTVTHDGFNSLVLIGEQILVANATPTTPMVVSRTVEVANVSLLDCTASVACQAVDDLQVTPTEDSGLIEIEPAVELSESGTIQALLGATLVLTCRPISCGTDPSVFQWLLNGVGLGISSSELTVELDSTGKFGNYTCLAVHLGLSSSVLVMEPDFPLEAELSGQGVVQFGGNISLTCTGRGNPGVNVTVTSSDNSPNVVVGEQMVVANATANSPYVVARILTVVNANFSNCYKSVTCEAMGSFDGQPSGKTTQLSTEIEPIAELSKTGIVSAVIGDTLSLSCQATSCDYDSYVFEWYLNGVELNESLPGVMTAEELFLSHLTVQLDSPSRFGNYSCYVVNSDKEAQVLIVELASIRAHLDPPTTVLSATPSSDPLRHNVLEGSAFSINCSAAFTRTPTNAILDFYKDGQRIDPASNLLFGMTFRRNNVDSRTPVVTLDFNNFGSQLNGLYVCNVTSEEPMISNTFHYRSYFTGPASVTVLSPPVVALPPTGPLELEAEFDGVYYSHSWVYHPTDPDSTGATVLEGEDGVEEDTARGRIVIDPSSSAFMAGYYTPRIYTTDNTSYPYLRDIDIVVYEDSDIGVDFAGNSSAEPGTDLTLNCTGTGYPKVSVNFEYSGFVARVVVGPQVVLANATPSTPFVAARSIFVIAVNASDCDKNIACVVNGIEGGVKVEKEVVRSIYINASLELSPSGNITVLYGDHLNLTCQAISCETHSFQFQWIHNGAVINDSISTQGQVSHLTRAVDSTSDKGVYECYLPAYNTYSQPVFVNAHDGVDAELAGSATVLPGESVRLSCVGTGYPAVFVNFDYDSVAAQVVVGEEVVLARATATSPHVVVRNLTILNVGTSDCYKVVTCKVNNIIDGVSKADVASKSIFIDSAELTLSKTGRIPGSVGDTVELSCSAMACEIDSFIVLWYLNDVEIDDDVVEEGQLGHVTVLIDSLEKFGVYTCRLMGYDVSASVTLFELVSVRAHLDPPTTALSATPSSDPLRHNVQEGSAFSINCSVTFTSNYTNASVLLYRDGQVVDGTSPGVVLATVAEGLDIVLTATFESFGLDDRGLYVCSVTSEVPAIADAGNFILYALGPPRVTLVSGPYQALPPTGPLELEAEFEGVYYNHSWVYHPTDPDSTGATVLAGEDGVTVDTARGRIAIDPSSSAFMAGYYTPRIYLENSSDSSFISNGSVLVRDSANITVNLTGDASVPTGSVVVLTCRGSGFPGVTVAVDTSRLSPDLPTAVGDLMLSEPSLSEPIVATRTVTLTGVSVEDCQLIGCTAASTATGEEVTVSSQVLVQGPALIEAVQREVPAAIGGQVHLACRASQCLANTFQFAWRHGGVPIAEAVSGDDYSIIDNEDHTRLNLFDLREEYFGEYTCEVLGQNVTAVAYLYEKDGISLFSDLPYPPSDVLRSSLSSPNTFNIREETSLRLNCSFEAYGSDNFNVAMYLNGTANDLKGSTIVSLLDFPRRTRQTRVIELEAFTGALNTGTYFCVAQSEVRMVFSRNVTLLSEPVCYGERDQVWGIPWVDTRYGHRDTQACLEAVNGTGVATRLCNGQGQWQSVDVKECESPEFNDVRMAIEQLLDSLGTYSDSASEILPQDLASISNVTARLLATTDPNQRTVPLFPRDLNATNLFLDTVSKFATQTDLFRQSLYNETDTLVIADHILAPLYENVWHILTEDGMFSGGAPLLLNSLESIALSLARELGFNSQSKDGAVVFQGERINVKAAKVVNGGEGFDPVIFPLARDNAQVCIPGEALTEKAGTESSILVVTGVVQNMTNILPRTYNDGQSIGSTSETSRYLVIAKLSVDGEEKSVSFEDNSVKIAFQTEARYCSAECVFWGENDSGWSGENVSSVGRGREQDQTVTCQSSHLTSFTVLVDYSPGMYMNFAFTVATYVGCAISLVCLLLCLLFFLCQKKEIIEKSVYFVHTNLCVALILGLFMFFFVEVGGRYRIEGACSFVTFVIHYCFLAIFFWMLCEGVMMYSLLVRVFGANDRKWFILYLFLGWGTPLIPALITIIVAYSTERDYFIMTTRCQWLCWLSQRNYFIWAFIAPMLLIILINFLIGLRVLYGLIKFFRKRIARTSVQKQNMKIIMYAFKSFICLLPLLGLTWLFGLLAANQIAGTVFAWLFIACNTLQGLAFFLLHVVRHDSVWTRIKRTWCCRKWTSLTVQDSHTALKSTSKSPYAPQTQIRSNVLVNPTLSSDPLDLTFNTTGDAEAMEFTINRTFFPPDENLFVNKDTNDHFLESPVKGVLVSGENSGSDSPSEMGEGQREAEEYKSRVTADEDEEYQDDDDVIPLAEADQSDLQSIDEDNVENLSDDNTHLDPAEESCETQEEIVPSEEHTTQGDSNAGSSIVVGGEGAPSVGSHNEEESDKGSQQLPTPSGKTYVAASITEL